MPKLEMVGKFKARAVSGEPWTSPNKGTDAVKVMFEVTEGTQRGKHVWWTGWMSDRAYQRTVEALRACGWRGTDIVALPGLGDNEVEVDVREENGYFQVAFVNDPNRVGRVKMAGAASSDFAERMKAKILVADEQMAKSGHAPPPPQHDDTEDDLPPELRGE